MDYQDNQRRSDPYSNEFNEYGWPGPRPLEAGGPYGAGIQDYGEKSPLDFLMVILSRWWIVLIAVIVSALIGGFYVYSQKPVYMSQATLELVQESEDALKKIGGVGSVTPMLDPSEVYATKIELLQGRWLSEALVNKLDLANSQEFSKEKKGFFRTVLRIIWPDTHNEREPEPKVNNDTLVKDVMSRISAKRTPDTRLLVLSFKASEPMVAKDLLTEYINIYMAHNLAQRRRHALDGLDWLNRELARVEGKLVDSLAKLVEFTNKYGLVSTDEEDNHLVNFFNKAAEDLVEAKAQRVRMEAYSQGADSGLTGAVALPDEAEAVELKSLRERLAAMESEYSELSQIYAENYPRLVLLRKRIESQKEKIKKLESQAVSNALEGARRQEELNRTAFEQAKKEAMDLNSHGVQRAILKKEVEINDEIYRILLEKNQTMALNSQIIGNDIRVIDQPTIPRSPISPKRKLIMAASLFLGLIIGVLTAVLIEDIDDSIYSAKDVQDKLGLDTLAVIPDMDKFPNPGGRSKDPDEFTVINFPRAPVSEAIRSLKNRIFYHSSASLIRTLMLTSSVSSEGKTFVAVSLAIILAKEDEKRVLLIESDMRRSRIGAIFGLNQDTPGLGAALTNKNVKLSGLVRRCEKSNLYYIPSGPPPSNPAGLLGSQNFSNFLGRMREKFDVIIIDCPPALGFSDALIAASHADGVVLLTKMGEVPSEVLMETRDQIMSSKGRILGVVLTRASSIGPITGKYGNYRLYRKYYGNYS